MAKRVLFPHPPQQLSDAKEYCITILPQINSEYCKQNSSKGNTNVDDNEDNNLDSVDREFYNDPFQNLDYQEGYNLINVVKFCKDLHTCIPIMLGSQLASQDLNRCIYHLSKVLGSWRTVYTVYSNNWTKCKCTKLTHSSILSHAKSMASIYIYTYIVYKYLVCLYFLDDGTLRKCIVQDPSHDQRSITAKPAVGISGKAALPPTDTKNDSISLEMNVPPLKKLISVGKLSYTLQLEATLTVIVKHPV